MSVLCLWISCIIFEGLLVYVGFFWWCVVCSFFKVWGLELLSSFVVVVYVVVGCVWIVVWCVCVFGCFVLVSFFMLLFCGVFLMIGCVWFVWCFVVEFYVGL